LVFKRDVLLWEYWEFSDLKDTLTIKTKNIIAKKLSVIEYDIKIKNAKFKDYEVLFSSDYMLDKHIFKNIVINCGNYNITINWIIPLNSFIRKIWLLLENYEKINKIQNTLINSSFSKINIDFYPSKKSTIISSFNDYKWVILIEIWENWSINQAILNWKSLIKWDTDYNKFVLYLQNTFK
jgi:hypothetical protein